MHLNWLMPLRGDLSGFLPMPRLSASSVLQGQVFARKPHIPVLAFFSGQAGQLAEGSKALATTATTGFQCIKSCAGPPTGTPASIPAGQIPAVVDSTNSKLYLYIGGTWKSVTVA